MNILILARWDHSGAGYALYQAVNEHTRHEARQVCYEKSYLGYPYDLYAPTPAELRELCDWADVINLHDGTDWLMPKGIGWRPMVTTYHGTEYRARWPWFNITDFQMERPATALNLDLCMFGPRWLPRPVPDMLHTKREHNGSFRVAHAPTNRYVKDTETVLATLEEIDGIEVVLIEGVNNAECLKIKAGCDLLVEEFKLGYGTNAMETWATGMPVIGNAYTGIKQYMRFKLGELPFVETDLVDLRAAVERLRDDRGAYDAAARKGRNYWNKHHRPDVVADKFIKICQEAMDGGNE